MTEREKELQDQLNKWINSPKMLECIRELTHKSIVYGGVTKEEIEKAMKKHGIL